MDVKLSTFNNDWYNPGPSWKRVLWYFVNEIVFRSAFFPLNALKCFTLRLFGAEIGKGVVIKPRVNIKYPWFLTLEDDVWIGEDVWIDNLAQVKVERDVCISQGAYLLCGNHDYRTSSFELIVKSIHIERGAWVGARVTVCPGSKIGSYSVVVVGSVVVGELEPLGVYRGNPATFLKPREIKSSVGVVEAV